jgi:hypothetical protein
LSSYPINFGLNGYQKSFGESLDNSNTKEKLEIFLNNLSEKQDTANKLIESLDKLSP